VSARDADVVIAGAGASGLSLAVRLLERAPHLRVELVEPRAAVANDRTFCFFRGPPHPFEAAIARRWEEIEVRDARRVVRRRLVGRPYEELPGGSFHALAEELLARSGRAHVSRGVGVRSFTERADDVEIVTTAGTLRARLFVDARGGARVGRAVGAQTAPAGEVRWAQHFVGQVVRTERPIFEPGRATLMDFDVPQDEGPHFVYVLPSSRHEALVEDTYFSPTPFEHARYERTIGEWLERAGAGAFEVLRSEHGVIPMTTAPQARSARSRVAVVGQRGGAAKPSTGYAFQFIQRQTDALARLVAEVGVAQPVPWVPPRSHVATFYDRVFLSYLRANAARGPELFVGLFDRVPPASLARFLSEEGTVLDHLLVMNAVPRRGVVAEIARSRSLWLRER
jgi:lycopene beta-cyclase